MEQRKDSTKSLNPPSVPLTYRQNAIDQEGGGGREKLGGMEVEIICLCSWDGQEEKERRTE